MAKWIAFYGGGDVLVFRADTGKDWGNHDGRQFTLFPVYNLRGERGYALVLGRPDHCELVAHWFKLKNVIPTYMSERVDNDAQVAWKVWHCATSLSWNDDDWKM